MHTSNTYTYVSTLSIPDMGQTHCLLYCHGYHFQDYLYRLAYLQLQDPAARGQTGYDVVVVTKHKYKQYDTTDYYMHDNVACMPSNSTAVVQLYNVYLHTFIEYFKATPKVKTM